MSYSVKLLQRYLNQNGNNLQVDGIFGAKTSTAIDNLDAPPWVKVGLKEVGTKEINGKVHSARVIEYHKTTAGKYSNDEVPWCGSFVNWVMIKSKYGVIKDGNTFTVKYPERAKSWLEFGQEVKFPTLGAIAVKTRSGGGHVCFVIGTDGKDNLYCLGGNQNNEVNIQLYPRTAFIEFRVPTGYREYVASTYDLGSNVAPVREA